MNVRECTCVEDVDEALARLHVGLQDAQRRVQVIQMYMDNLLAKRKELAQASG